MDDPNCIHELMGKETPFKLFYYPLSCTFALVFYMLHDNFLVIPSHHKGTSNSSISLMQDKETMVEAY